MFAIGLCADSSTPDSGSYRSEDRNSLLKHLAEVLKVNLVVLVGVELVHPVLHIIIHAARRMAADGQTQQQCLQLHCMAQAYPHQPFCVVLSLPYRSHAWRVLQMDAGCTFSYAARTMGHDPSCAMTEPTTSTRVLWQCTACMAVRCRLCTVINSAAAVLVKLLEERLHIDHVQAACTEIQL